MKNRKGKRGTAPGRLLCVLFAVMAAAGALMCTGAAEEADRLANSPDMILAKDAAARMNLRTPDGDPLEVRCDPTVPGRGEAGPDGGEPDYTGMLGFAALPKDPEISKFSVFDKAYWTIPLYLIRDGEPVQEGSISHKTPVVVTGQTLKADENGGYRGLLEIVRLDVGEKCLLDVSCFVTLPYWMLPLREVPAHGYSIAVYRETPGEGPRKEDGKPVTLRDGTRILIPFEGACPADNPDPEHLNVQGVVFTEDGAGTISPIIVWFRENDLFLNY